MFQEILINAVASRRCLWDKNHKDYKDTRTIKTNNWTDVKEEVNEKCGTSFSGKSSKTLLFSEEGC